MIKHLLAIVVAATLTAGSVNAGVIPGPLLNENGGGWTTTGLSFSALTNTSLTSFVYQNQGQADTIVLTDAAGNILQSLNTPSGNTSYTANVNWALTSGSQYWLLQTVGSNELFTSYGNSLPSDAEIQIVQSGTFAFSIGDAVTGNGWGANQYWAAFNNITTGAVPEPGAITLLGLGLAGLAGYGLRRRKQAKA
jgi:hypothetical protein